MVASFETADGGRLADDQRVVVTVQWRGTTPAADTRADRKRFLAEQLSRALSDQSDLVVDWSSISPSAQTVEATVPRSRLVATTDELMGRGLRVDEVMLRQIVE